MPRLHARGQVQLNVLDVEDGSAKRQESASHSHLYILCFRIWIAIEMMDLYTTNQIQHNREQASSDHALFSIVTCDGCSFPMRLTNAAAIDEGKCDPKIPPKALIASSIITHACKGAIGSCFSIRYTYVSVGLMASIRSLSQGRGLRALTLPPRQPYASDSGIDIWP